MSLKLIIANKNYSSWSMRPWVLMRQLDIPFEEVMLKFHSREWKEDLPKHSPSGMVPVLWDGDAAKADATWESTAIFETINDKFPDRGVWPRDAAARNHARAIVAEMHAGFRALRMNMPMNIRSNHAGLGMNADVAANIKRIETLWREARARFAATSSEPYLFGAFSAADAMYAPVVMRFNTYHPPLAEDSRAYCAAIQKTRAVKQWVEGALLETEFVPEDEPYAINAKD
jgi:glutathione S-transferase